MPQPFQNSVNEAESRRRGDAETEICCDVLVVGGSLGGVAAAARAACTGVSVCLAAESEWIGGQLTAQGVCVPDENDWIESAGSTASYRCFRQRIRDFYRSRYQLSARAAKSSPSRFHLGNCWVDRFAVEPKVARRLLYDWLKGFPELRLLANAQPLRVERDGDTIRAVILRVGERELRCTATIVLDATDLGDLLPMAQVEHVVGAESNRETGEPSAPGDAHPDWVQPLTVPFILECRPAGEDHTIQPPPDYEELKALQNYRLRDGVIATMFDEPAMWTYRRVVHADNFSDPAFPHDLSMINTDAIDLMGGVLPGASDADHARTLARGRRVSLGYVYWLQTECPRDDDPSRRGYPELKLRKEMFDTDDGLAPSPYIRESRRIRARVTVREQHIVTEYNPGPRATLFHDSCGVGHYAIDIHRGGAGGQAFLGLKTRPFQIPTGALIPRRVTNLLAASKNLGVTHVTNGAYRVHPIEWNIGESAGALAGFCVRQGRTPHQVHDHAPLLRTYQRELLAAGIPLFWWSDVPDAHPAFVPTQLLGIDGILTSEKDLRFRPNHPLAPDEMRALDGRLGISVPWPSAELTRAEAAIWLASELDEGRLRASAGGG